MKVKIFTFLTLLTFVFIIHYPEISSPSSVPYEVDPSITDTTVQEMSNFKRQKNRNLSIPVFMYHSISKSKRNPLCVPPAQFEKQLRTLIEGGFTPITATELNRAMVNGTQLPPNPFVITMDDGYLDNYYNAFPILKKYNAKATIFVITSMIQPGGSYLGWDQLKEMEESGLVDIESHTVNHVDLKTLSPSQVKKELKTSRLTLESHLHKPVEIFCYPGGKFNNKIMNLLKETGYTMSFTTRPGFANYTKQGPLQLHRIRVFPDHSFVPIVKEFHH